MVDSRHAVAATIREAIRARGVRQREIATVLGISQAAVSNRLTGHTAFTLDDLDRLAAYLGVTVAQLLEPPQLLVDDDEAPSDESGKR